MTLSSTRNLEDLLPPLTFPAGPQSLVQRWREVAAALPDVPAAVDPGDATRPPTRYTFAEVDRLSDLVALDLVGRLGDSDLPVAALLGHDANAVVALIALLKTGRIRVVLDTHLPVERLHQIVTLAGSRLLLVDDRHVDLGKALHVDTAVSLDSLLRAAAASTITPDELATRVRTELAFGESRGGRDPFEIVFTSGSTGTPKGVVQVHGAFLNDFAAHKIIRGTLAGEGVAVVLPLSFVAGSEGLVNTLFGGSTAHLIDPRDSGVTGLVNALRSERLAALIGTPHLLRGVVSALGADEILPDLHTVVTLGEAIHGRDVAAILAHLGPDGYYVNEVGASELDTIATFRVSQGDSIPDGNMPAGRMMPNKSMRIIGEGGADVAPGESGELIVVSEYLSGGYWHNDEQNTAKFGVDDEGRAYARQGDLARVNADGILQLLGRGDAGVKVRGYLVEPSEIEGALLSLDEIAEAVVIPIVTPGRPTRLTAYVVPRQGVRSPSTPDVRRALRAVLPEYMVPSEILQLTALPRTERGKVDRQALPPVPERVVDTGRLSPSELAMAEVWQKVLELPAVGADDDFMALGGDSLSVEELSIRVKDEFGKDMVSSDVIAHPTLREFTARILADGPTPVEQGDSIVFNASAPGEPVFAFAGATALAFTFLPLANHLNDHPVHTFQQHALERRGFPDRSIEAVAARHLATIREVRPHGPYRLIGHSYGGLVALEAARQLTEAGETVESLVILDTYLPDQVTAATRSGDATAPAESTSLVRRLLPNGIPDRKNVARQIRARLAGVVRFRGEGHYDAMFDLVLLLQRRYDVRPYAGRTALVLAHDNPDGAAAWDRVLTGERVDIPLATEHDSLLREPFVETVAELLLPFLDHA